MRNANLAPAAVKSAVVIFAPGLARRLHNPAFGAGVLAPARQWASDADYRRHVEETTYSAAEWKALQEEARIAAADRYHRDAQAEAAELAELGISAEAMDRLAAESAELDRVCGIPTPAALAAAEGMAEVRTIQVRGRKYVAELIASQDDDVTAAVRLTSDRGAVYDVAKTIHGIACTCPDHVWKREGLTGVPCKHGRACNAYGLLDAPEKARKPRPTTLHQRRKAARYDRFEAASI